MGRISTSTDCIFADNVSVTLQQILGLKNTAKWGKTMFNDPLAAALSKIMNAERIGKKEVDIKPASLLMKRVLQVLQEHQYLGSSELIEDGKGGILKVNLLGNVNKCGVVKPRFSTKYTAFEKWEKRYLPAKDFGIIVVSTSQGLVTHTKAKELKSGGKLVAFCY